jgi:hypothetical protein
MPDKQKLGPGFFFPKTKESSIGCHVPGQRIANKAKTRRGSQISSKMPAPNKPSRTEQPRLPQNNTSG